MSLEQALNENTQALNALIGLLTRQPQPQLQAPAAISAQPAQTAPEAVQPDPEPAPPVAQPASTEALTYPVLAKRFQRYAKADREAAIALLAEYGAKNLQEVDQTKWAEIAERMGDEVAA